MQTVMAKCGHSTINTFMVKNKLHPFNKQVFVAQLVRALVSYRLDVMNFKFSHPKVVSSSLTEDTNLFADSPVEKVGARPSCSVNTELG